MQTCFNVSADSCQTPNDSTLLFRLLIIFYPKHAYVPTSRLAEIGVRVCSF